MDATKKIVDTKNLKEDEKRTDLPSYVRNSDGTISVKKRDNSNTLGNSKRKPNFGYNLD
jgi:hypothetical protein